MIEQTPSARLSSLTFRYRNTSSEALLKLIESDPRVQEAERIEQKKVYLAQAFLNIASEEAEQRCEGYQQLTIYLMDQRTLFSGKNFVEPKQIMNAILKGLQDRVAMVRGSAANAIAISTNPIFLGPLLALSYDKEDEARVPAYQALGSVGGAMVIPILTEAYKTEEDDFAKMNALYGLGRTKSCNTTQFLLEVLKEEKLSQYLRIAATCALAWSANPTDKSVRHTLEKLQALGSSKNLGLEETIGHLDNRKQWELVKRPPRAVLCAPGTA